MNCKLTDMKEGETGSISRIGKIGRLRDGLYDVMAKSGSQVVVNSRNSQRGCMTISFAYLKLSLSWKDASAIQVEVARPSADPDLFF